MRIRHNSFRKQGNIIKITPQISENQTPLDGKIILDYPCAPNVITYAFKSGELYLAGISWRCDYGQRGTTLLTLNKEKGGHEQGMWEAFRK